jgi:hypothetical protein
MTDSNKHHNNQEGSQMGKEIKEYLSQPSWFKMLNTERDFNRSFFDQSCNNQSICQSSSEILLILKSDISQLKDKLKKNYTFLKKNSLDSQEDVSTILVHAIEIITGVLKVGYLS